MDGGEEAAEVATETAARCRVLCLDEMQVNDITDAMIMGGLLQALFARKGLGPGAGQHDVDRVGHDPPRQQDGIADVVYAGDRAGVEVRAVHDRGIEFVAAFGVEHGAATGVEERRVLEQLHGVGHRVQAAAAAA